MASPGIVCWFEAVAAVVVSVSYAVGGLGGHSSHGHRGLGPQTPSRGCGSTTTGTSRLAAAAATTPVD